MKKINKVFSIVATAAIAPAIVGGIWASQSVTYEQGKRSYGAISEDKLLFELNSSQDGYILSGHLPLDSKDEELQIPQTHDGLPIVEVGPKAFWNCRTLKSIVFTTYITKINDNAFANCPNLQTTRNKDSNITHLGTRAFSCCTKLQYIDLPDTLQVIGDFAFEKCPNLTYIRNENRPYPNLTKIGKGAFTNCTKLGTEGSEIDLDSPNLLEIDDAAFRCCKNVRRFRLAYEGKLQRIGNNAFQGCTNLDEISNLSTNTSLLTVGSAAFKDCTSIGFDDKNDCSLPDSVTSIGQAAFQNCSSISLRQEESGLYARNFHMPINITTIEPYTFKGCSHLTISNLHECNIQTIGEYAFEYVVFSDINDGDEECTTIFPGTIQSIGDYAFRGAEYNAKFTLPNGCKLGKGAFASAAIGAFDLSDWDHLPNTDEWPQAEEGYESDRQFNDFYYKNGYFVVNDTLGFDSWVDFLAQYGFVNGNPGSEEGLHWHQYPSSTSIIEFDQNSYDGSIKIGGKSVDWEDEGAPILKCDVKFNINDSSFTEEQLEASDIQIYKQNSNGDVHKDFTGYGGEAEQIQFSRKIVDNQIVLTLNFNPLCQYNKNQNTTSSNVSIHITNTNLNLDYYVHNLSIRFYSEIVSRAFGGYYDAYQTGYTYPMYSTPDGTFAQINAATNTMYAKLDPNFASHCTIEVLEDDGATPSSLFEVDSDSIFVCDLKTPAKSAKARGYGNSDLLRFQIKPIDGAEILAGESYYVKFRINYDNGEYSTSSLSKDSYIISPTVDTLEYEGTKMDSYNNADGSVIFNVGEVLIHEPSEDETSYTVEAPKVWNSYLSINSASGTTSFGQIAPFEPETEYQVELQITEYSASEYFDVQLESSTVISNADGSLSLSFVVTKKEGAETIGGWKAIKELNGDYPLSFRLQVSKDDGGAVEVVAPYNCEVFIKTSYNNN